MLKAVSGCLKQMFPDSQTAADMKLGKDKISYSIVYGLPPYFKNKLTEDVSKCDCLLC